VYATPRQLNEARRSSEKRGIRLGSAFAARDSIDSDGGCSSDRTSGMPAGLSCYYTRPPVSAL